MDCKEFKNSIVFYIDGDLNDSSSILFENHLKSCHECKLLFDKFKLSYSFIEEDRIAESNPFFYSKLMATIETKNNNSVFSFIGAKRILVQFATYVIIGLLAVVVGYYIANDRYSINQESVQSQDQPTDQQLLVDSYDMALTVDDMYLIKTNETEE